MTVSVAMSTAGRGGGRAWRERRGRERHRPAFGFAGHVRGDQAVGVFGVRFQAHQLGRDRGMLALRFRRERRFPAPEATRALVIGEVVADRRIDGRVQRATRLRFGAAGRFAARFGERRFGEPAPCVCVRPGPNAPTPSGVPTPLGPS